MKEMIYKERSPREILDSGKYLGAKYTIISLGSHPTAYVENIVNAENYDDDILYDIEVHGGFTYDGKAYWNGNDNSNYLGWDYAHCEDYIYGCYGKNDKKWTTAEIKKEVFSVIEQLTALKTETE